MSDKKSFESFWKRLKQKWNGIPILPHITNGLDWKTWIFMITNIIYFIPIILFGPDEFTIPVMVIGLVSILFHIHQVVSCTKEKEQITRENHPHTHFCLWLDMIVGSTITLYIIISKFKQIPFWWWIVLVISIISWVFAFCYEDHYWWLHGIWHILTGFLLLVAVAPDNDKKWAWTKPES